MSETSNSFQKLDTVVVRRLGSGRDEDTALIVAICDAPTYTLVDVRGNQYHWRQDLTRPASDIEAIAYWRERAVIVEALHARLLETFNKAMEQNLQLMERLNQKAE